MADESAVTAAAPHKPKRGDVVYACPEVVRGCGFTSLTPGICPAMRKDPKDKRGAGCERGGERLVECRVI